MLRLFISLAAMLALSGCFTSDAPLYAESAGSCPITSRTVFGVDRVDVGRTRSSTEVFSIEANGRFCVRTDNGGGDLEGERALFVPLDASWYVVQREPEDEGSTGYVYSLARVEGDQIAFYAPDCRDFTAAALAEFGITASQALRPTKAEAPAQITKRRAKQHAGSQPATVCTVTETLQLEHAFRAWIALDRAPTERATRMR